MNSKTVSLAHIKNLDLDSITIRTTNGNDQLDAASRCIPLDGKGVDVNIFGLLMRQQMVIQGITGYTLRSDKIAKTCVAPPVEAVQWSSRTREFVGAVYDHWNGVTRDEADAFQEMLEGKKPGSTPGSSSIDAAPVPTQQG